MFRSTRNRNTRILSVAGLLLLSTAALAVVVTIPIHITTPSTVSGGSSFTVTVSIQNAASEESAVIVDTSRRDLIASPTGSWPYTLTIPANATSAGFTATAGSVSSSQDVQVRTCASNENISDPEFWRATRTFTVNP